AMRHHAPFLLCLCAGLANLGCDQFVDKSKYDAAVKEGSQAKLDLQQTKAALEACKQKPPEHHYELRTEGFRTFRFDPSTGGWPTFAVSAKVGTYAAASQF
ncbi:MAG TPA: hypothetical protein VN777_05300, partial [Terriglobales bacterium]|nr:hypothetical protein [Terriglobales bacterium]